MGKVQEVNIKVNPMNKYATIMRSLLTAANAAKLMGEGEMVYQLMAIEAKASERYIELMLGKE